MIRLNRIWIGVLAACALFVALLGMMASGKQPATAVASNSVAEMWLIPNRDATQDGNLQARLSTAEATAAEENIVNLGQWQRARAVSYDGGITLCTWSTTQGASIVHVDPKSLSSWSVPAGDQVLPSALYDEQRQSVSYQDSESVVTAPVSDDSQTRGYSQSLPALTPDVEAGTIPAGYKGEWPDVSVPSVQGYATVGGRPVALVTTGAAAGVMDLTDMKFSRLSGFSGLYGAATGGDGYLYVAAWRSLDSSFTIKVLRLDPKDLHIVGQTDTGLTPGKTDNITITPSTDGAVVMIAQGSTDSVRQFIWTANMDGMKSLPELPIGTGLYMAPDVDSDSVLLFGGPATNRVSRLNIVSGALTVDVPELRAPAGSYVVAVDH
jgi:hypothetical protein